MAGTSRQAFPEKIRELEMEGARISWDELTCVGYPVSENATEKLCRDIESFREKAGMIEIYWMNPAFRLLFMMIDWR